MQKKPDQTKARPEALNGKELELIALNAAFEAARAGKPGAGLATLANELKESAVREAGQGLKDRKGRPAGSKE